MKLSKRTRWLLASPVLFVLLALLSYVIAGPYLAINGIRTLVASEQYGELWRFMDFDQLRESVRPQLQQQIVSGVLDHVGNRESAKTIGEVTALLAKPAIDAIVSPQGIATLLTGSALAQRVTGHVDANGKAHAVDPLKDAQTRFESTRLFTATVANAEGQPVVFEFRRTGLTWKLTGLRLPD